MAMKEKWVKIYRLRVTFSLRLFQSIFMAHCFLVNFHDLHSSLASHLTSVIYVHFHCNLSNNVTILSIYIQFKSETHLAPSITCWIKGKIPFFGFQLKAEFSIEFMLFCVPLSSQCLHNKHFFCVSHGI